MKQPKYYLFIAGTIAMLFVAMIYLDYRDLGEIRKQRQKVQKEIDIAKSKQDQLPNLLSVLYIKYNIYEKFKQLLPNKQQVLNFYDTLEAFRLETELKPWKYFKSANTVTEVVKSSQPQKKQKGKKQRKGPQLFTQTKYLAAIPATFNQLGQLLNIIEAYPRFLGVTELSIPVMTERSGKDLEGIIKLTLVNYTYSGKKFDAKFNEKVINMLQDFTPNEKTKSKLQETLSQLYPMNHFQWSAINDPFDQARIFAKPDEGQYEKLKKQIQELETTNKLLQASVQAQDWKKFHSLLNKYSYEQHVDELIHRIVGIQDDPEQLWQRITNIRNQLKEWKDMDVIQQHRIIQVVETELKNIEDLYTRAQQENNIEILEEALEMHKKLNRLLRRYQKLTDKVLQLKQLQQRASDLYRRITNYINITQLASKLELQGIIYMRDEPNNSIVFINNRVLRYQGRILGFIISDIKDREIILKHTTDEKTNIRLTVKQRP